MVCFNILFLLALFSFTLLVHAADVLTCVVRTSEYDGIKKIDMLGALKNMALYKIKSLQGEGAVLNWKLEGRNDGQSFEVIADRNINFDKPELNNFLVENLGNYQYYQLTITSENVVIPLSVTKFCHSGLPVDTTPVLGPKGALPFDVPVSAGPPSKVGPPTAAAPVSAPTVQPPVYQKRTGPPTMVQLPIKGGPPTAAAPVSAPIVGPPTAKGSPTVAAPVSGGGIVNNADGDNDNDDLKDGGNDNGDVKDGDNDNDRMRLRSLKGSGGGGGGSKGYGPGGSKGYGPGGSKGYGKGCYPWYPGCYYPGKVDNEKENMGRRSLKGSGGGSKGYGPGRSKGYGPGRSKGYGKGCYYYPDCNYPGKVYNEKENMGRRSLKGSGGGSKGYGPGRSKGYGKGCYYPFGCYYPGKEEAKL